VLGLMDVRTGIHEPSLDLFDACKAQHGAPQASVSLHRDG
jgi:hypothetical protein